MPETLEGRYSLEEGDQLVMLNGFDVIQKTDREMDVFSVDTDVFILLVGNCPNIPKSVTVIRKKKEKLCKGKSYNKRGPNRADAITGWYAFKTGGFASKKKQVISKHSCKAMTQYWMHFLLIGPQQKFLIGYSIRWKDIMHSVSSWCVSYAENLDLRWI